MSKEIRTENLSVGYDGKVLIEDINITAKPGEIVTLIGPNGSGKTTILKTILKQLSPVSGCVYIDGNPLDKLTAADIAKQMSMVTTRRPKTELMTCRDVVATGRYPYTGRFGILSDHDWEIVDKAIEYIGAGDTADSDFLKISDGQKQRIMIARAMCQEPEILILDEPTSYLDIRYKLDILMNIRKYARDNKVAVIMSLHELDLAKGISDRIVCVENDHIGKIGSPCEIFSNGYIQQLYKIDRESFDEKTGMLILPDWGENG